MPQLLLRKLSNVDDIEKERCLRYQNLSASSKINELRHLICLTNLMSGEKSIKTPKAYGLILKKKTVDVANDDFLALIQSFNQFNVRYIIVGGFSTNFHGYKRATGDIDFWIEDTLENRQNLVEALDKLGLGRYEELLTAPLIAGFCEIMLDNGIYADLMNTILGFEKEDFIACFDMAVVADIQGIAVRFLHYNHLIHSKSNSNRLKDTLDVEQLQKLKQNDNSTKS